RSGHYMISSRCYISDSIISLLIGYASIRYSLLTVGSIRAQAYDDSRSRLALDCDLATDAAGGTFLRQRCLCLCIERDTKEKKDRKDYVAHSELCLSTGKGQ